MDRPCYQKTRLQAEDFSLNAELDALAGELGALPAVATFTGRVRPDSGVEELFLEHYPGMTEKALQQIVEQASARWPLDAVVLIHRFGRLKLGEQIVLVITAAAHRKAAYSANAFIMDYLKSRVPLWKQAIGPDTKSWIRATDQDIATLKLWQE